MRQEFFPVRRTRRCRGKQIEENGRQILVKSIENDYNKKNKTNDKR